MTIKGLTYTPLFRTLAYGNDKSSMYYLHKETGSGYRVKFNGERFHEIFLGMRTMDRLEVSGGFEIIDYIKANNGNFPYFSPKLGLGLVETFDITSRLVYPCGIVSWNNDRALVFHEIIESLGKEKIVLRKNVSDDLQFHYGHALVEMYDSCNPLKYLQS